MYNMCIINAPFHADMEGEEASGAEPQCELALGFANRSAAMYRLGLHEKCLQVKLTMTPTFDYKYCYL